MELLNKIMKLEFLASYRTYIAIGSFMLANIAEWAGADVPGFVAMEPLEAFMVAMTALGIYERAKAP